MNKLHTRHAIILGAGPVGLITAWRCLENGISVDVFEKTGMTGGMCRTWEWGDFLVDCGPHIYHTPDKKLATFFDEKFGDLMVKGEFWCKNVKGDQFNEYYDYPLSWDSISRYPTATKQKILDELKQDRQEDKAKASTYKDYIDAEVGPTLREMFFEKYPRKIWGISTEEMTANWAPKRIEFRSKVTPFYHGEWNAVGKYGTGCIYDRIKEWIIKLGGKIHLNTPITGFDFNNNKIHSLSTPESSIDVGVNDLIISSLPITHTARFLGYNSTLKFRGICTVVVAYDMPSVLPEGVHWLYYDSEELLFNRVTEAQKMSPLVAPKGKSLVTAEITYTQGDEFDHLDTEKVKKLVVEQLEMANLGDRNKIIDVDLNKEPFVYPLQYTGYQEELARVKATISDFSQLYSLGTGGDFNYADSQILFHKSFDLVDNIVGKESSHTQVIRETKPVKLNKQFEIGDKVIGEDNKTFIIAEVGLNHNGSVELAKKLIDEAKLCGCDAVKLQSFSASSRVSKRVKAANYAETITGIEENIHQMFDRLSLTFEQQNELFEYSKSLEIPIFSTPFDIQSLQFLETVNTKLYKIASMDLVNLPLIKEVAATGKPIVLSTGMSTLGQIEEAVSTIAKEGNPNLVLLHCNSTYPAAPEDMNLDAMETLRKAFRVPVGLSDHTFGLFVSHTAIALGANVIERHFTLDRTMEGPDHILSSEPREMAELVRMARQIPLIKGDGIKRIQSSEYDTLNLQRKSLYTTKTLEPGHIIKDDDICIKGPGGGLLPKYIDIVKGRTVQKQILEDFPVTWEAI